MATRLFRSLLVLLLIALAVPAVFAQQTGSIRGRVTATDGSALPGVTVEARSNVLPTARVTTTDGQGDYRLPALPPGSYTLTFSLSGMQTSTRKAQVQLSQETAADMKLGVAGLAETVTVTAEATLVEKTSTALQSGFNDQQIHTLPVGTDFRDLQKLIPGVMYSEDTTRGPSSGASGQDNVYQIDGVKVTLPQYGTLSANASNQDVAQVTVTKGGSKATDFDRSGGFTIDSVSKSGTNKLAGELSYRLMKSGFSSKPAVVSSNVYQEDRTWGALNLGGPILKDKLFFYTSYYRPERTRDNRANNYGELPKYKYLQNEYFGKLTLTPISSLLFNLSYRDNHWRDKGTLFGGSQAATTGSGNEQHPKIAIAEGSWIINNRSYATFKVNDYKNPTASVPDYTVSGVTISTALGTKIDINNLGTLGLVTVPCPNNRPSGAPCIISASTQPTNAYNTFIAPYINKYGYVGSTGERVGGGQIGYGTTFDEDNFFRKLGQIGYNLTVGSNVTHDLHAGYQQFSDDEDLIRSSNGWGSITIPGGSSTCAASICGTSQPIYFAAAFQQQSTGAIPPIHSEYKSQNVEVNDTIRMNNWTFNVGTIVSQDTLYGSGLKKADNAAGWVKSIGSKYEMYKVPWGKLIQPRVGATWAYNGEDTVYVSYTVSNPAVSSLPRAASFDRGNATTINAYFDQSGSLIGVSPIRSSNGKLFVPDMKPRTYTEYMVGTAQQITSGWSTRVYARSREGKHFWEDTPNNDRVDCGIDATGGTYDASKCLIPANVPRTPYIPDLKNKITAIGTPGATYVIAELDGAFTKYYEATAESDYNRGNLFLRGSYTWSHYYGNFDQDNTTTDNDLNIFVGSSNIADGPGRNIWDMKYGNLRGDRRHMAKVITTYMLPWHGSLGAVGLFQSGQPWEAWNYEIYKPLTGGSTSDTIRYGEPAGSRRTPNHHQIDLNYTQNFGMVAGTNLQLVADVYNIYNKRTGYSYQPSTHLASFGQPRLAYAPRRFQLTVRAQF